MVSSNVRNIETNHRLIGIHSDIKRWTVNNILLRYPVYICSADQIKIQRGRFVISNTNTSQDPGKHWVTFSFPKRGHYEFFDSLGNRPEDYGVGFEKILNKKYLMSFGQLRQAASNVCGLYCAYYVMKRHSGENHETHCERL